jgi:hypothetical protein
MNNVRRMHTYEYTYIHTYIHTYTYVYKYIETHTNKHTYIHAYVYTYVETHVNKYTYIHTHTYIHTYKIRVYTPTVLGDICDGDVSLHTLHTYIAMQGMLKHTHTHINIHT